MLKALAIANLAVSTALMVWSMVDINRRPPPMTVMKWYGR